jgi:putative lipoic acid-binding regulatory protein
LKNQNPSNFTPQDEDNKPVLEFPVTYHLKVIFDKTLEQHLHHRNLELVLEDTAVKYSDIGFKPSRLGNYVSISVNVQIETEAQMQLLYKQLRLLPGIKMAI